jgi:hypothetical protein
VTVDGFKNVGVAGTTSQSACVNNTPVAAGFDSKLNSGLTQTPWTTNVAAILTAIATDSTGIYLAGCARAGFVTTSLSAMIPARTTSPSL